MLFAQAVLQASTRLTREMFNFLIAPTAARASTRLVWGQFPRPPVTAAQQVVDTAPCLLPDTCPAGIVTLSLC